MSDLLPPNATRLEQDLSSALAQLADVPVPIRALWDADTIPLRLLPWLAWAVSVDEWDAAWDEEQKRAVVKTALIVQRKKGTIGAVREALAALGIEVQVQEWWQQTPHDEPYTFRIYIEPKRQQVSAEGLAAIGSILTASKNLRSHLKKIQLRTLSESRVHAAAVTNTGNEITISKFMPAPVIINEMAIIV